MPWQEITDAFFGGAYGYLLRTKPRKTPPEAATGGCAASAWNITGQKGQRHGGHVIGSWIEKPEGL